ncbi:hypothetical protein [Paraburkholderia sp.]|uniref:hypothetical protein n=1 Tax=Paraburkholderia sp. TaxID=1926495 RepID=UPI002D2341F2|nr:hypothetical protein [Paraburkholderia sp.]HZZ05806.1 hypothetical protein [Paraburkholderia sp.]
MSLSPGTPARGLGGTRFKRLVAVRRIFDASVTETSVVKSHATIFKSPWHDKVPTVYPV